jgi:KDO2-lipid IV(A) lauroyltransferase
VRPESDLKLRWNAGAFNNGLIFSLTYHGVRWLPLACSYALGDVGTWLAYKSVHRGTAALVSNLRVTQPDLSDAELQRLALLTYRTYARDTIDFIRSLSMTPETIATRLERLENDHFDELLALKRGIILLGGHFGNWEFGGVMLRVLRGYPLTVVAKTEASPVVNSFRRRMRDSLGIDSLEIGQVLETALQIRGLLAKNQVVAMLADRHIGRDRVDVDFFGRKAAFVRTPAMVGLMAGAPLLPSFMLRQPDGRFVGYCGDPIFVDPVIERDRAIQQAMQTFATVLEGFIRRYPHLWYQFYPYWGEEA